MSALREQLDELLVESPAAAAERERTEYDRVAGDISTPIVLFGAARLGRLVLKGLRQNGVEPAAFADNNAAIWDTTIEGVPVLSPVEAGRRFGDNCVFVIAIWGRGGSDRMQDRERRLRELGCRRVVTFGALYWKFPAYFLPRIPALDLPHKVLEQAEDIRTAFQALSDERSRAEFVAQLRW